MHLAAVVDPDRARAESVGKEFGVPSFAGLEQLFGEVGVQAASVTVPTIHHVKVASALMQAGIDILVEKPLAMSLAEADQLIADARSVITWSALIPRSALRCLWLRSPCFLKFTA